jgi:hypothetical protein
MLHKTILASLALIVIGLLGTTGALARGGGGGDFPAVGYPFAFGSSYQPHCHVVQRRVVTRYGWRGANGYRR